MFTLSVLTSNVQCIALIPTSVIGDQSCHDKGDESYNLFDNNVVLLFRLEEA